MPALAIAQPAEIGLDPRRLQLAYDLLETWTTGDNPQVPGGAILAGRNGRIVEPCFFGRQGPEPAAEAIRRDSVFLLASISKPLVYTGAMLLVERGELNLCDHVTRYIPDFAAHHKENTLVLHLFTHTSGLPDMLPNNVELRRAHAPLERFVEGAIRDTVPLFPPGTDLSYQSMGTLIVAELVRRISGKPIDIFLREEVFNPLGMQSTRLGSSGLDRARIVRVEVPDFQQQSDFDWNSVYWQQLGSPWGGVFSSPEDMAIICQMLLNGGQYNGVRLLALRTVERMTTNRLEEMPDLPEAVRRSKPWGLGWRMNHPGASDSWGDLLGRHVYGHTGASGTMVWIDPQTNGFCILFTSALREKAPWRLIQLSNAIASAFV